MPDDCITDVSPGHHVFTCDGYDFDVEIPAQCIAGSCGLIVDVHGLTMDADMQDANTTMRALGAERGYVVVQPNAINSSWVPGVDDGPVHAFALRAASVLQLDTNRLHFTGFSQGGAMSWRMLCDHADVYASIAPAAMCTPTYSLAGCAEGTPSILYIHGRLDALVGYAGCAEPQRDAVLDAYGLEGEGDLLEESDGHRHRRWGGGDLPSVEMIDHDYAAAAAVLAGHCYPGSADLEGGLPGQVFPFACVEANTFVYGETIIDFFDAHPKR
ncbi:MAG: alpha/beta hydrolase family esterase [Nannocystaceae bacterium]|nr:hypothetical protein [bacterium]